jgi:glycosyltransferase involved in cell wall biosynthesis
MVVPDRHPTGVPMKCLEAWARGLPIVGTALAAEQLETRDGEALLVADGGEAFVRALRRLVDEPGLRERLLANGRSMLRGHHDPADVARRLIAVYASCR